MTIKIIEEKQVKATVDWRQTVSAIEQVMAKAAKGEYISPPRHHVTNDNGGIAFTIGGDRGVGKDDGVLGFRVYDTFPTDIDHQQFTAVFNAKTGELKGIVLGEYIGAVRTGALGGAAINALSRKESRTIGIVGSGLQARTQLRSALAVRDIASVRVYSRDRSNCEAFIADIASGEGNEGQAFAGEMTIAADAKSAVTDADIVILATRSSTPVIEADWLAPGCHLNTVGPKSKDRHELPVAIADKAAALCTDSPAQIQHYADKHFLRDHAMFEQIKDLSPIVAGHEGTYRRADGDITVFLSAGLAGTEPAVANQFL